MPLTIMAPVFHKHTILYNSQLLENTINSILKYTCMEIKKLLEISLQLFQIFSPSKQD